MPPTIHPELLQQDPFLQLEYWNGPYPLHAATTTWHEKAIYFVAQCDINVGVPKRYPFKPIIVMLARKNMIIYKASDLTLCRRISLESVGSVYSNAKEYAPTSSSNNNMTTSAPSVESSTGFIILKEAASSKGGRSSADLKSGDSAGWGGDIALQGPKSIIRSLLQKLMILIAYAKKLSLKDVDGTTFGASLPGVVGGGGVMVDLSRGSESSLLDTTVAYMPPAKTTDTGAAFIRTENVVIARQMIAERFLGDNPHWKPASVIAALKAKEEEEEKKRATPWCVTARRIADLKSQPVDFLPTPQIDPKLEMMYNPLSCVSILWSGRLALSMKPPEQQGQAMDQQEPNSPMSPSSPTHIVVCAFMTQSCLYLTCNGFEILRCIPLEAIRTALVEEKVSRRRTASMSPLRKDSVAPFANNNRNPAASPQGGDPIVVETIRVRVVLFYYALVSAAPPQQNSPLASEQQESVFQQGTASGWSWEAERLTLEFETQPHALSFFEVLKCISPTTWRVDQLQQELGEAQIERESTFLADSLVATSSASHDSAASSSVMAAITVSGRTVLPPPPPLPSPTTSLLGSQLLVSQWCPLWRRSVDVQWIAFRVRLFAFYEKYCPHKLSLVDKVVWEWKDAEEGCEDVMATLARKYGKEPDVSLQTVVLRLVADPTGATAPPPLSPPNRGVASFPSVYGATVPPPALFEQTMRPTKAQQQQQDIDADSLRGIPRVMSVSFEQTMKPTKAQQQDIDADSLRGIPRVMSVSSMRSGGGGGEGTTVPLTSRALEKLNAPLIVNRSETVARSLGQTFQHSTTNRVVVPPGSGVQRSPSPDNGAHAILSVSSMAAAASAAGPGFGATIGDVLRSFAFSVTFFDRFAAMYFPAGSGINSGCEDPEKVHMFQRLIRAYAPNEDAFYTTLIHRAEQRRSAEQQIVGGVVGNVGASPVARDAPPSSTYRSTTAGRPRHNSSNQSLSSPTDRGAAYDVSYEPSEPNQSTPSANLKFHVDPASAWGQRSPPRNQHSEGQPPSSALTMLRRYQTQSQGSSAAPFSSQSRGYNSQTARGEFIIADDDLKAAIVEPLTSSIHLDGSSSGSAHATVAMLPPMFSAKRPDAYLPSSGSHRNGTRGVGGSSGGFTNPKSFLRI
ncbi:Hypothetical protein, putative [Bodo saltans]|uniref:Uncharacterized protein n=1 Tax=Bodo saltans TaxID=75058 RepID=A0A0S4KJU9_BODSA|nr:Hypothetical protein, putative [Bodo saltans]|eukprot:CUI14569.1 Hypothetical protein, putative [Bodo saltans]